MPAITWMRNVEDASLDLVAVVDGATGKLAGIEKKSQLTTAEASLYIGFRSVAGTAWQFRPNIPSRIPSHVQFHCKN